LNNLNDDYINITFEYEEFTGLGNNSDIVKVSSSVDKFTILPSTPNLTEIEALLDEVYMNMATEVRYQMHAYPESWLSVIKATANGYRFTNLSIPLVQKSDLEEYGDYISLAQLVYEGQDQLLWKVLDKMSNVELVHAVRNNRLFCTNTQPNAYQILNASQSVEQFFESFCFHYFLRNASQKKRWVSSYFNKLCEAMCLKGWLLYPLSKMTVSGYIMVNPHLNDKYLNIASPNRQPFPNKVFIKDFDRERLKNFHNMGEIIIKQGKADGGDCYGFLRRLTFMTDAKGVGGLSEGLCIHLTNDIASTGAKKSHDAPVERLVNDYLTQYRNQLEILPNHVYAYKRRQEEGKKREETPRKYDGTYKWAVKIQPQLEVWANFFEEYTPYSTLQNISDVTAALNPCLDWLMALSDEELSQIISPENLDRYVHIYRRKSTISITFIEYLLANCTPGHARNAHTEVEKFCLWYVITYDPYYEIPVHPNDRDVFENREIADKSNKEVIPTRLFKLMKQILVEDDYAWAKTIGGDWTGRVAGKGIWCPSRALMLETMMILPIRYSSCMSADLGLLDMYWFSDALQEWELNPKGIKKRKAGIFQQLGDIAKGESIIGFFFNQSKTTNDGLTVTWDNKELRDKLLQHRQFILDQKAVFDFDLTKDMTKVGKKRPANEIIQPLFLDFAHRDLAKTKTPVSYVRMLEFFRYLQVEVERRFNTETRTGQESPIKLIYSWESRKNVPDRPLTSMFTLQGLRVTGITNFALAGLSPAVIAEMLSGHKTIVMNLFYTKFGVSLINKLVSQKAHEIEVNQDLISMEDWRNDLDLFRKIIEVNVEDAAFESIDRKNFHLMSVLDGFICPNGGTRCDEGNIILKKGSKGTQVEGGKGNCPSCRFAMTGPMLLNQQILVANKKLFELEELVRKQKYHFQKADEFHTNGEEVREVENNNIAESMQPEIDVKMSSWLSRISFINKSVAKLPVWDKIENMRKDGYSEEDIKVEIKNMPADINEKTLITMSNAEEITATFEYCETKAEQIAINACAEQILPTGNTSCSEKLTFLLTKALIKNGSEPFITQLNEANSNRAAALHAQFLTTYLQTHAKYNMNNQFSDDYSFGRVEMGKLLETSDHIQLPQEIKKAWDAINKIIIDVGKEQELPISLMELSKSSQHLKNASVTEIEDGK